MEDRARRFLVELRGDTPAGILVERLGYRSDPFHDWEAGVRWPTAAETLRVCTACGVDLTAAFRAFDPETAPHLADGGDLGVGAWLRATCGRLDAQRVAGQLGRPTSAVRRWLGGQVRPLWPDFIAIVDLATGRSEDLLALLTPHRRTASPTPMGAARRRSSTARDEALKALAEARRIRGTPAPTQRRQRQPTPLPISQMPSPEPIRSQPHMETTLPVATGPTPVLAELEETVQDEITVETFSSDGEPITLDEPGMDGACGRIWDAVASDDYALLELHRPGWIEARTGLTPEEVDDRLQLLADAGAIAAGGDRWRPVEPRPMFGADLQMPAGLPDELAAVIRTRAAQITISLSVADVTRVRALGRATIDELAAIEASSSPKQTLLLVRADPAS